MSTTELKPASKTAVSTAWALKLVNLPIREAPVPRPVAVSA